MLFHENTVLTKARMLTILRLYLGSVTRALASYIKDTGEDYANNVAITQLLRRFERNDFLADSNFERLQRMLNLSKTKNFRLCS